MLKKRIAISKIITITFIPFTILGKTNLSKNTGQKKKRIETDTNRDNFLSSEKALEYGLIDEIVKERK